MQRQESTRRIEHELAQIKHAVKSSRSIQQLQTLNRQQINALNRQVEKNDLSVDSFRLYRSQAPVNEDE